MVMASVTSQDWLDAAYRRFMASGLSAIKVEAVARDLGATKGSFYWHWTDRAALVHAVVLRWEHEHTEAVIATTTQIADPMARLESLFASVQQQLGHRTGEATLYLDAEREGVRPIVERVARRRIVYLGGILEELGQDAEEAERRATVMLGFVIGLEQLVAVGGEPFIPSASDLAATAVAMASAQ
jgi:AcrR family transcriptional regulator